MNKKEALLRVSEQLRVLAEDGTTVSWDQWHEDGWVNFRFKPHHEPQPESQKLPLCANDVKAGAQFLSKCGQIWFPNHIREGYVCFGHFMSLTFQELIDDEWKIRCAGETEWRPCYKLVEQ